MGEQQFDVCVVGAGAAGIVCAQSLVQQGFSVALIERLHPMPDCLKAEKIAGSAVSSLLRLGFQEAVDATLTPLYSVGVNFGERALGKVDIDPPEAGALYHDLINELRAHLDPRISFQPNMRVMGFNQGPDKVEVITDKEAPLTCRIVLIATGDARQLLESLGGTYETQAPDQAFVVAFSLEGKLESGRGKVDAVTFHHPVEGGPVAYATIFRQGGALRANIFCPGPIDKDWQQDLKQRPLQALAEKNRLFAEASKSWNVLTPTIIRKVQVAQLSAPSMPRIVVLGDVAHTIDPSGGGGLTFALLECELLLSVFLPRWLQDDDFSLAAIQSFYDDPRRLAAVQKYFGAGKYIFALNHDASIKGKWRRARFMLEQWAASRKAHEERPATEQNESAWKVPTHYLYESVEQGSHPGMGN